MSIALRVFSLQQQIKKNKVNRQRKSVEVKRLRQSYDLQIQDYLYSLFISATHIWNKINLPSTSHRFGSVKVPLKPSEISEIELLTTYRHNFPQILGLISRAPEEDALTLESFLFVLGIFNFLWSNESIDTFCSFVLQSGQENIPPLIQCFLIHPLVQKYFVMSLKPVFSIFHSEKQLVEKMADSLVLHSALFPPFLKKIFKQSSDIHYLFYEILLKPFIINPVIFNIATPDIHISYQNVIDIWVSKCNEFFYSQDGTDLVAKILANSTSVCTIPSEIQLLNVSPRFKSLTIVETKEHNLIYASSAIVNISTTMSNFSFQTDSISNIVRRILLKSDLIYLDEEYTKPIDYFLQLVDLSSVNGNSYLETELDKLCEGLKKDPLISMDKICTMIESEIEVEDKSHLKDPLAEISSYHKQYAYIDKLIKISQQTIDCSTKDMIFNDMKDFFVKFVEKNAIPEKLTDSAVFINYYQTAASQIPPQIENNVQTRRILHSLFLHELLITEEMKNDRNLIEEDKKLHRYIESHQKELIDDSKLPFLNIYKNDQNLLNFFFEEIKIAFQTQVILIQLEHIHNAFDVLNNLLQNQGIGEVGADQMMPFTMMAFAMANPFGIAWTSALFSKFLEPIPPEYSVVDHSEEYSLVQFMSTYQFMVNKMRE